MAAMFGLQALGGYYQAEAERQAGEAKQRYYDFLAGQNEAQAVTVQKRGEEQATAISGTSAVDESNLDRNANRVVGQQRAALGASGVTADSVTAEDISRDTSKTHALDKAALRYDADSKIWAARTAAEDTAKGLRDQAAQFRVAGANARSGADVAANASLLGSATSVADTWYRFSQAGGGRSPGSVKVKTRPVNGYQTAPDYGNA